MSIAKELITNALHNVVTVAVALGTITLVENIDGYVGIYIATIFRMSASVLIQMSTHLYNPHLKRIQPDKKDSTKELPLLPQLFHMIVVVGTMEALGCLIYSQHWLDEDLRESYSLQLVKFIPMSFAWELTFDFVHYWGHRLCHSNKTLYKYIHQDHHLHDAPGPLSGYAISVPDFLLTNIIPGLVAFSLFSFRWTTFQFHLLFAYKSLLEVGGHSGLTTGAKETDAISFYQFWPFGKFTDLSLQTRDHDLHHSHYNLNYSKRFKIWDVVFGTYQSPETLASDRLNRGVDCALRIHGLSRNPADNFCPSFLSRNQKGRKPPKRSSIHVLPNEYAKNEKIKTNKSKNKCRSFSNINIPKTIPTDFFRPE